MLKDNKIVVAMNDAGEYISLLPKMANRHGLIAGATGTGKTVTLKILAESFSDLGVPVFLADVKGDLAGLISPGTETDDMKRRIEKFKLADGPFTFKSYPVTFWDIYGEKGIQLRTTISEMGPLLLSRILQLNELQSDLLTIVFKIADDNNLLLIDTKDLKAMLNYVSEHRKALAMEYGNITEASVATIVRALVALETAGGKTFFGEPALNVSDWFLTDAQGRGMINVLDSESLISNGRLYSTFLLWLLSELFETLPEVGDLEKPKMVFFFDEAHLLFKDTPKTLLEKIEQVVKLIRSKGIGVYFITQNPRDIPEGVLAQLGNKVEHALRAYTPNEQKGVRAAADSFRENPAFDTYETIMSLGTGEAVISFLQADGTPGIAEKTAVLPPQSAFGGIDDAVRGQMVKSSPFCAKYAYQYDPDSAYEFLLRMGFGTQQAAVAPGFVKPQAGAPGYSQQVNAPGYSQQAGATGYGATQTGYGAPQTGYVQQPTGYAQQQTGYSQPGYAAPQQAPQYAQPQTGYVQQPQTGYVQPQQAPQYTQSQTGYVQPQTGYVQQPTGYVQSQTGYVDAAAYTQAAQQPDYTQPGYAAPQQSAYAASQAEYDEPVYESPETPQTPISDPSSYAAYAAQAAPQAAGGPTLPVDPSLSPSAIEAAKKAEKEAAAAAKQAEKEAAAAAKQAEKEAAAAAKQAEKEAREKQKAAEKAERERQKQIKQVGNSIAGTVGREVGKTVGKTVGGTFGKTLGGNVGASIGRTLLGTLFKTK